MIQNNYGLKIISIFGFISILLSSLIAYINPATGYELSIYSSTPLIVWILLILSIAIGITIIIHQVYVGKSMSSNFWLFGFLILILSRVTLLYIPYIRGYYSWRGDNISHVGLMKEIISTGSIPSTNFYPVTHILLTELTSISGAPIEFIVNYSTALLSCFYVISIFLVATSVFSSKNAQLLTLAAIGGVLFNGYDVYLMPNGWSILFMPLVFFLMFRSVVKNALEYRVLFAILLLLFPFFHPLSSIMLILMFLIIGFTNYLIHHTSLKKNFIKYSGEFVSFPVTATFILITIFVTWLLSFRRFDTNIRGLWIASTSEPNTISAAAQMGAKLDKINIHGLDFINLFIKLMGDELIFLILSAVAAIILFQKYKQNKYVGSNKLIIFLNITFFIGFMYLAYILNIIPGLENIGSSRLLAYLVIFTPIMVGFILEHLMNDKAKITALVCISVIMVASTLSMLSLYPSPYVSRPNIGITQMDMYGMNWYIDYKDRSIHDTHILSPTYRFADAILGKGESDRRVDIKHYTPNIPDHFNYTSNEFLGNSYSKDKYAVITMFDKTIYDTVWDVVGRFNKKDFEKLEQDLTVGKLYSNGECDVWYIHANK